MFPINRVYDDVMMCNVATMSGGHILLGRPSLYHHKVKHDKRSNMCIFKHHRCLLNLQLIQIEHKASSPHTSILLHKVSILKVASWAHVRDGYLLFVQHRAQERPFHSRSVWCNWGNPIIKIVGRDRPYGNQELTMKILSRFGKDWIF